MRRLALLVVVGFSLFALARPVGAVLVDSTDDDFTINFGGNIEGTDVAGLTASALFDIQSISGNTLVMAVTVTNTSSTALWDSSRVSAFGFNTDPTIESATLVSTVFSNVNLDGSFPNGFGNVNVCVINNRNNCSGGAGGGLNIGESTTVMLTLNFDEPISAVELENFGVRYQSLNSDLLGFDGDSGTGRPGNPVPEPGSTAMFLLGGVIVATVVRKQVLTARS